ncbi:MAG: bifunctional diaminohydroxyphosphoribosylaminopyrimidine deaminase/5-amino-6-(5-phosphoribosylamino)uracil reductase RibD [Alphaproteobacteria bacterium]|nr:bifunctional diaminohydroxyphosphoribosylaminopyrimidine deaminase/5-amino-6-(5-phosphoribosylamino)uracil reductase RibD [Alphaproteobacteria bacterium]
MKDHFYYMRHALEEAKKGTGRTSPNPAVGAIIVRNGQIVGRGYHKKAGTPHAEIHAIQDAGELSKDATLYVTLEPCNHTGRTPPCTEAILRAGITHVVIGMADLNPCVTGGGAAYLQSQGVDVCSGILEQQCKELNYPFIKHSTTRLPWIIMKAGLSLDGKITFLPKQGAALTGSESNRYVHQVRNQVDAILIGVETACIDNPSLTTRLEGNETSRDPLRIVLDSRLRLPTDARVINRDSSAETWVFCGMQASQEKEEQLVLRGVKVWRMPLSSANRLDLFELLRFLGKKNITSVLVEGGSRVHGSFYHHQLVDELLLFYAPFIVGDQGTPLVQGYSLDCRPESPIFNTTSIQLLGNDFLFRGIIRK